MSAAPKVLSLQDHTFKKRQPQPSVGLAKTGARVVSATRSRVSTPEQEIQQVIRQLANFKRQAVGKSKAYATKLVQVTQKRLSTLFSKPAVRQYIQHLDEASHATLMADFQAVLVFKSQIKLVPTRQVVDLQAELQRAQQLFKAGSGAGSDDDAGTPRSDTSTDSLDEAMRNHEPRRSRGNSTDSDDSDRSVAAGAVSDESKAIEALRARLKAALATSESLIAKYRQILTQKPKKTSEVAIRLYANMRKRVTETTELVALQRTHLEEFDSTRLKELIDTTRASNKRSNAILTSTLDYLS